MNTRFTTAASYPLSTSLEQPGFKLDQIARLAVLRDDFPSIEFVDSAEEQQRLLLE